MIQGIVGVLIGLMFLLIGFGVAPVSNNLEANAVFVKRWGMFFIIGGPTIALVGVVYLLSGR